MPRRLLAAAAVLSSIPVLGFADDPPVTVPVPRMHADLALRAAQATVEACRGEGLNIAVTVVDRGGHAQLVLRDTLAMPVSLEVSRQKAVTAMNFNAPTSVLVESRAQTSSLEKIDGVIFLAGGLPINAGGSILGGIGVSGAPSGAQDEACAQAGLDAIIDDLEMGM